MLCADIAIVTDRKEFSRQLQENLQPRGIVVMQISKGELHSQRTLFSATDMVILDCSDLAVGGLALCRTIRGTYNGPLGIICLIEQEEFILLALELGVDFSISTTGSPQFIAESIRALLLRLTPSAMSILQYNDLQVNAHKRDAFVDGRCVHLSTIEFRLLWLLCIKTGQVVSRETIHRKLYRSEYNGYDRASTCTSQE